MCSYLAVSKKVATAIGLGAAVIFVLAVTVPLNWLLDQYLLRDGALVWLGPEYADYNLNFLSFILFIATIATMVQLVEITLQKLAPPLYQSLGIYLPLITTNCAVLGVALLNVQTGYGFFESVQAENMENNIYVTILIPGRVNTSISFIQNAPFSPLRSRK